MFFFSYFPFFLLSLSLSYFSTKIGNEVLNKKKKKKNHGSSLYIFWLRITLDIRGVHRLTIRMLVKKITVEKMEKREIKTRDLGRIVTGKVIYQVFLKYSREKKIQDLPVFFFPPSPR